ncbi:DUF3617 domain-containing protein [Sphingomonas swuensis]
MRRLAPIIVALLALPLLGASAPPGARALAGVQPGLWEVSRSATGQGARRICLRDVASLASFAHPRERCQRTILGDRPGELVVDLQCVGGEFARSRISVTTPRSLKLESQGIHGGEPFDMTLYARRVGPCRPF